MKKIPIIVMMIMLLICANAHAKTIYTNSAREYAEAMSGLRAGNGFGVSSKEYILLVRCESDLDLCGANYDICDEYYIHTLFYNDEETAETALAYYESIGIPACRDDEMEFTEDSSESEKNFSDDAVYMGIDVYNKRLLGIYQSEAQMPAVNVAVVDSGIDYTHTDLADRVDNELGYDFYNNDDDAMDDHSHGTHVAGIIIFNTPSNVRLIPIKITDSKGSTTYDLFKTGIQKAVELNTDVINLSLGAVNEDVSQSVKEVFQPIFDAAYEQGTVMCVAACNATRGVLHNSAYIFPAYMDNAIVTANTSNNGTISSSSNYGAVIDIAASGVNIYSTVLNNSYGYKSGTSMSCPFVSAAAALLKTENKSYGLDEIESLLKISAEDAGDTGFDIHFGYGIMDLSKAADLMEGEILLPAELPPRGAVLANDLTFNDESGIISARFTSTLSCENTFMLNAAAYDEDDILTEFKSCDMSLDGYESVELEFSFESPDSNSKAAFFSWLRSMEPVMLKSELRICIE